MLFKSTLLFQMTGHYPFDNNKGSEDERAEEEEKALAARDD